MNEVSPAMLALYQGKREQGEELLGEAPDVFEAAAFGLTHRLREILTVDSAQASARAADDFTALHLAAFFGHCDAVEVLLAAGASVSAEATNTFVRSVQPLHSAAANGDLACCQALLQAGADVDARQGDGFTPLMEAAQVGDAELARLFLETGAETAAQREDGTTARTLAEHGGHRNVLALLDGR